MEFRKIISLVVLMAVPSGLFAVNTADDASKYLDRLAQYAQGRRSVPHLDRKPFEPVPARTANFNALNYNQKMAWFLLVLKEEVERWRGAPQNQKDAIRDNIANFLADRQRVAFFQQVLNTDGSRSHKRFMDQLGSLKRVLGIRDVRMVERRVLIREPFETVRQVEVPARLPEWKLVTIKDKDVLGENGKGFEEGLNKLADPSSSPEVKINMIQTTASFVVNLAKRVQELEEAMKTKEKESKEEESKKKVLFEKKLVVKEANYKRKILELQNEIAKLKEQIKAKTENAIKQVTAVTLENKKLRKELETLKEKLGQETKKTVLFEKQFIKKEETLKEDFSRQLTDLKIEQVKKSEEQKKMLDTLMKKIDESSTMLKKQRETITKLGKEKYELKKENDTLREENKHLNKKLSFAKNLAVTRGQEVGELKQKLKKVEDRLKEETGATKDLVTAIMAIIKKK